MNVEHVSDTGFAQVDRMDRAHERSSPESETEGHEGSGERTRHVARCGFEIVGAATGRPGTPEATVARYADGEPQQDRIMGALASILEPGHTVTFVYEGGASAPLRWRIVGEADSVVSSGHAVRRMRELRTALMTVLESRKTYYRFKPLPECDFSAAAAPSLKWLGCVEPRGTEIKHTRGGIGFAMPDCSSQTCRNAVCLPHYVQERTKAFGSPVNLLMSSPIPLRIAISLAACRLDRNQRVALRSALDSILDASPDSEVPAHLQNAAGLWLKTLAGCRIKCEVSSAQPVHEPFLKLLGGEMYHGPVDVSCRLACETLLPCRTGEDDTCGHVLDLRDCIPATLPLPSLFPPPEVLARYGMRRFFNREEPNLPKEGVLMGAILDGHAEKPVRLCRKERSRHMYILGATGTGKSTLLYNLIMQDIRKGEGVCLVDPHGDLYHQVLDSIPSERADDVVLLDPSRRDRAVGINLLECEGPHRDMQRNFVINEVLAILEKLYDMKTCGGPMFEQYFRSALQLVMSDGGHTGTLVDMSAVFEHKSYRDTLLKRCADPLLTDFWKMAENAGGEPRLANIAPYIVCKVNLFVHNAMIRPIIGQAKSTVDFREIMDRRRILLVNLARGALGELDMRLLGMVVLTKLMCAAMSRLDVAACRRTPCMVYVDEFQNFTTDATASLLSESRKFGLCLTLANQNLAQLTAGKGQENLVHSVLGNVGSMVLFRLGAPDAEKLAVYTKPQFGPDDLQTLPNFHAAARILTPAGPTAPFVFQTYAAKRNRTEPGVMKRITAVQRKHSVRVKAVEEQIRRQREVIRSSESSTKEKA